ncbi:MAG: type II toxin-antitoxin system PemK/MazF family toxin, partial [Candidatus Sericytochromatia bacterium]
WMVKLEPNKINNLNKKSVIDLFQISSVSVDRFIKKIGEISNNALKKAKESIKTVFDINE